MEEQVRMVYTQGKLLISEMNIRERHGCLQMAWDLAKTDQTLARLGKSGSSIPVEYQRQGTHPISRFLP